ncbi:MAG TPA: tRNA-intron lyase [Candidatus Methanoperedenaceae archaeon]|nr:tRNA-intron lyase [Candidatus Methanoperedenaceae archaeon]
MSDRPLQAELRNSIVLVEDGAKEELYRDSFYGRPAGKHIELSLAEAAYLLYRKKIQVIAGGKELDFRSFFEVACSLTKNFELKYIVYSDLRGRGYYVQPGTPDFRVYPRGGHPGKTPAEFLVRVLSERNPLPLPELLRQVSAAANLKKSLVLAIVDEESDITFYGVKGIAMKGTMPPLPEISAAATLLEDRAIIWDKDKSGYLHRTGFFGNMLDEERLQLSLVEGAYLMGKGLSVTVPGETEKLGFPDFRARAEKIEPEFMNKYAAYADLRASGLVAKTGFKFGTHFRVYSGLPKNIEHSKYLVHAIEYDHAFSLQRLSRAVRLSHSVRKTMVYAFVRNRNVGYIGIERMKL